MINNAINDLLDRWPKSKTLNKKINHVSKYKYLPTRCTEVYKGVWVYTLELYSPMRRARLYKGMWVYMSDWIHYMPTLATLVKVFHLYGKHCCIIINILFILLFSYNLRSVIDWYMHKGMFLFRKKENKSLTIIKFHLSGLK